MKRRDFLKFSAVGGASVALSGCGKDPVEKMIPMLVPPSHYSPGNSIYYATTCRECTAACGLHVKTREGRAVKIEGNPSHPFNRGKVCAIGQAALQSLYSPARNKAPLLKKGQEEQEIDWLAGIDLLVAKIKEAIADSGRQILFIGPPETGTMRRLIKNTLAAWGGGDYVQVDLAPVHSYKKANEVAFGERSIPEVDFSRADTLINFGADFLESWLNPVQFTRRYTKFHAYQGSKRGRFVQVSSHLSLTGANADRWHSCQPGTEHIAAFLLANRLLDSNQTLAAAEKVKLRNLLAPLVKKADAGFFNGAFDFCEELAQEFQTGRCVCLAGGNSTAGTSASQLHLAVNLINYLSGAINRSIRFGPDIQAGGDSLRTLRETAVKLHDRRYALVIVHNVNPVYALPQVKNLVSALKRAPFLVSLSTETDETSRLATLSLPTHHYLESWGDSQPAKGIYALQQPVMKTLPGYDTRELGDLLLQVSQLINPETFPFKNFRDYLTISWQGLHRKKKIRSDFADFWNSCLRQGGYFLKHHYKPVTLQTSFFSIHIRSRVANEQGYTLLGLNSNLQNANGHTGHRYWLLETPHPISQVAWASWVDIHPQTAHRLGIADGDGLEISSPHGAVQVSARLFYGIDPQTIAMPTGLGRSLLFPNYETRKGRFPFWDLVTSKEPLTLLRQKIGDNVLTLFPDSYETLSGDFLFAVSGIQIKPLGKKQALPTMDGQSRFDLKSTSTSGIFSHPAHNQKARGLVRTITTDQAGQLAEPLATERSKAAERRSLHDSKGFYEAIEKNVARHLQSTVKAPPPFFDPYKWEMVIDLDRCTGCSACVVACYAENNIAIVGKDRVRQGREMSWLRIERFFEVNPQTGRTETYLFPQMCAQCDNAGCEPVCPVLATYKTSDGLNAMIYNRCIGSRYCSNNCIYGQRRFNWRTYQFPSPLHYQLNPDVSVREKGVMEKCTFCQQRIREKLLAANRENRNLKESEVQTACQQTCPANAITFGNSREPSGNVAKLKADAVRSYTQFESMNYQPAITYLKKVIQNNQKA